VYVRCSWSDIRTWVNQEPPVEGDFVVIPPFQTVLLDMNPPKLSVLLVEGSLVFDRKDLALDAGYILMSGGTFEIGLPEDPFLQRYARVAACVVSPRSRVS
jgi:hypothetical protein